MNHKAWGYHLHIDLAECNPESIRSPESIHDFVVGLCDVIQMKRYGDPIIVHFGDNEDVSGYSLVQLIETSNITGHFVEQTNDAYLDIFSCKPYSINQAEQFCADWFQAKDRISFYMIRQAPNSKVVNESAPDVLLTPTRFYDF